MSRTQQEQFLLAHLGRQLAGETKTQHFLEIMSAELRNLLGASECRIYLDPRGRRFLGTSMNGAASLAGPLGQKVQRAVRSGLSVRLDRGKGSVHNLLAAPMLGHDGRLLGYIEVANKLAGEFHADDEGFLMLLASITGYALENEKLNHKLQDSHLETIYRLATIAEYRDPVDLTGHLRRMSRYSGMIAEGIGLSKAESRNILYASPLHDIGKVAIPDKVLHKPAKLTEREYDIIKKHTVIGAEILSRAKSELLRLRLPHRPRPPRENSTAPAIRRASKGGRSLWRRASSRWRTSSMLFAAAASTRPRGTAPRPGPISSSARARISTPRSSAPSKRRGPASRRSCATTGSSRAARPLREKPATTPTTTRAAEPARPALISPPQFVTIALVPEPSFPADQPG